jgi:hypothetical protein
MRHSRVSCLLKAQAGLELIDIPWVTRPLDTVAFHESVGRRALARGPKTDNTMGEAHIPTNAGEPGRSPSLNSPLTASLR